MELTKKGLGIFSLIGNSCSLVLNSTSNPTDESSDILIGMGKQKEGQFDIQIPGEYEVNGVSVISGKSFERETIDFAEIIFEEIRFLAILPGFKYSKETHDFIGQVDVLLPFGLDRDELETCINKFDPEQMFFFADDQVIKEGLEKMGIKNIEETKKAKLKKEDFGLEDFVLQVYSIL